MIISACLILGATCQPIYIRVIDGDTIAIGPEHIRLLAVDAPEISKPRCAAEAARGAAAANALAQMLEGARLAIDRHGTDRYGRTLAHLTTAAGDVGAGLEAIGMAIDWYPGRYAWDERRQHWCGGKQ